MPELTNPDDYPMDCYDYEAWLAVPPPASLGSAIRTIVAEVVSWDDRKRTDMQARFVAACDDDGDATAAAEQRCVDALDDHPIGESASCQEITTVDPWLTAIRMRVGAGAQVIVEAVAARDHDLISPADFTTLTGWWVEAGLPLPDPISEADRLALVEWWDELGVRVPARVGKP